MFGFNRAKTEVLTEEEARKVNEKFNSFKNKKYSEEDMNKVFDNEEKIMDKMDNSSLKDFIGDVKIFFSMLKDFFTKEYTEVPVGTIRNSSKLTWTDTKNSKEFADGRRILG